MQPQNHLEQDQGPQPFTWAEDTMPQFPQWNPVSYSPRSTLFAEVKAYTPSGFRCHQRPESTPLGLITVEGLQENDVRLLKAI